MADLDDAQPIDFTPDLSDLAIVTLNVETREGAQYSIVWAAEDGCLSLAEHERVDQGEHGFQQWTYKITQETP